MDCEESFNINILVVDHDEVCLAFVANTLMARQYKVQTAKNAHDALVTLRNNGGLFDIIITEFHVLGMNGFDFQKLIHDQFQIPVIMMSKDNREHLISKTLENGATHFIVKPVCGEDFRDIWKFVDEAKKHKSFIKNLIVPSEEQESSEQANTKKKDCKEKSIDESRREGKCQLVKKASRLVWTTELHSLFLDAIKKLGLEKAVPGKILKIMNIPNLTRDHVSSHLQKYRLFLDKVAEEGIDGDIFDSGLTSTFASNLTPSMIKDIQEIRSNKLFESTLYQTGERNNVLNIFNNFPSNNNDFSYIQKGSSTLQGFDQYRLEKSKLETNAFASTGFSSYGSRQRLMASSSPSSSSSSSYRNGSIGNDYFNHMNHGVKNWNFENLKNSTNLAQNVTCDARNNNPFGININNTSEMGGIGNMNKRGFDIRYDNANSNTLGLNVGSQNTNENFESLAYDNFGLVQGGFGSLSNIRGGSGSEFQEQLFEEENIVQYERNQIGSKLQELSNFLMADDMDLLNKSYKGGDIISSSSSAEINSCMLSESPISLDQSSNLLQGNEQFSNGELYDMFMGDKASTSATNQKLDMDLFEAVFGTMDN